MYYLALVLEEQGLYKLQSLYCRALRTFTLEIIQLSTRKFSGRLKLVLKVFVGSWITPVLQRPWKSRWIWSA